MAINGNSCWFNLRAIFDFLFCRAIKSQAGATRRRNADATDRWIVCQPYRAGACNGVTPPRHIAPDAAAIKPMQAVTASVYSLWTIRRRWSCSAATEILSDLIALIYSFQWKSESQLFICNFLVALYLRIHDCCVVGDRSRLSGKAESPWHSHIDPITPSQILLRVHYQKQFYLLIKLKLRHKIVI